MVANSTSTFVADSIRRGHVWIRVGRKYWRVRANGAVKLWKSDPERFRIPVKAGLYVYDAITQDDSINTWHFEGKYITCEQDPNPLIAQANAVWLVKQLQAQ